jgi:hypothetical protein
MPTSTLSQTYFARSLACAKSSDYVARLNAIYPVRATQSRFRTDPEALADVMAYLRADNYDAAARVMLDKVKFPRFPLPTWHSTIFRNHPGQRTDEAIAIVAKYLRCAPLTAEYVEQFCSMPPQANRQTTGFHDWVAAGANLGRGTGFPVKYFWDDTDGPWLIRGDDAHLKIEARQAGIYRDGGKGLDLLAKSVGGQVVWGEAKLLSDTGGNQDKSLRELLGLGQSKDGVPVAIIDGDPWLKMLILKDLPMDGEDKNAALLHQIHKSAMSGAIFLSALTLPDLLRTI